jgi:transcriptional regulator
MNFNTSNNFNTPNHFNTMMNNNFNVNSHEMMMEEQPMGMNLFTLPVQQEFENMVPQPNVQMNIPLNIPTIEETNVEYFAKRKSSQYWQEMYLRQMEITQQAIKQGEKIAHVLKLFGEVALQEEIKQGLEATDMNLLMEEMRNMKINENIKNTDLDRSKMIMTMDYKELIVEIMKKYPKTTPETIVNILKKRQELAQILKNTSDEHSAAVHNMLMKLADVFEEGKQLNPLSKDQQKEIVRKMYHKVEGTKFKIAQTCEENIRNFITKECKKKFNKLPEKAVEVLRKWFVDHYEHPYPSDVEKDKLSQITGLTKTQINNWFINQRVRVWKPTIQKIKRNRKL